MKTEPIDLFWVAQQNGETAGPWSQKEIFARLKALQLDPDALCMRYGTEEWKTVTAFWPRQASEEKTRRTHEMARMEVCTMCGYAGSSVLSSKGSFLMEVGVWLLCFFAVAFAGLVALLVALGYSIYRLVSREKVCPSCGKPAMIPATSPRGKKVMHTAC